MADMKEMKTLNGYEIVDAKARDEINSIKENGGGGSVEGAVLYTEQALTDEQKAQVRKNIGVSEGGGLNKNAVNALIDILRQAHYNEDVSYRITRLSELLSKNTDDSGIVVQSIKLGGSGFDNNKLSINGGITYRAILVPIGQYLKKGTTYKFSLGNAAGIYQYAAIIYNANYAGRTFPYTNELVYYDDITEKNFDTGYIAGDSTYTTNTDNCVLMVNFRKPDNTSMGESDCAELLNNFVIEEIAPSNDVVLSVKKGLVSHESGVTKLQATWSDRATLVPVGRYLEKGKTYRFGIGNIADKYRYCVQIFTVESAGLTFPYVPDMTTQYDKLTTRIVDTGWIDLDFTYTPDTDNCVFAVNFQTPDRVLLEESNYVEILENFVMEEFTESDDVQYRFIMNRGLSTLNDGSASITVKTDRFMVYSANMHDRVYSLNNGVSWGISPFSPIKIPVGATSVVIDVPDNMRYAVLTYENHATSARYVTQIADSGWIADGRTVDVSGYNDGNHYIGANIGYTNAAVIPEGFDTSTIDIYFVDADGNRMS